MGKKKCPDCEECLPAWLAAFGDLMSLLLCFFVLLLSMSSMDAKKISEAIGSLSGAMSVLEGGTQTEISKKRIQEATPIESQDETSETVNRIQEAVGEANEIMEKGQGPEITLEEAQEGFVIELPASLLFKSGSATIENEDALLFLKRVALIIDELPNDMMVSVQGHTDNQGLVETVHLKITGNFHLLELYLFYKNYFWMVLNHKELVQQVLLSTHRWLQTRLRVVERKIVE